MNKKFTPVFAALCLAAGAAQAQSSVTLYGVVDMAIEQVKGASTLSRVSSGQQQGSRWGLRGSEDLGNGNKAVFQIESGINADTGTAGQGGRAFGRQAFVGMTGDWGGLRLGRQYSPMDDIAGLVGTKTYDVLSVVPVIGNGDYNRVNNAITYLSPAFAGTTVQAQYSLGEERVSPDTSKDFAKQMSIHALHTSGPLTAGLSWMRVTDSNGTTAGNQAQNALLAVGSYDFGSFKLTAYFDQEDKAAEKLSVFGAAVGFKLGETVLSAGVAQAKNVNGSKALDDAKIYTLQATQNLSKRTALYGHLTAVSNRGSAALGFNSPVAGSNSNGIQFGIRHRF